MKARRDRQGEAGFTLVELIVALTLLGIMAAAMFGALRLSARISDAGATRIATVTDRMAAMQFLRNRLREAAPMQIPQADGTQGPGFLGTETAMQFIAPMPAEIGIGGFHVFTIRQSPQAENPPMLGWSLLRPDGVLQPDDGQRNPRPLFEENARLSFRYYGIAEAGSGARWYRNWEGFRPPDLIEIRLAGPDMERQETVIRVRPRLRI